MKAMILAAGFGTRLRPLTHVRPKALVPVMGTSMLSFWIERLHRDGFDGVVVNAHHLHEQMTRFVEERLWPVPVRVQVEPVLLDTGGGIRNVLDFFEGEPFVVVNGDVLCDASPAELHRRHRRSGAPASLLMHDCPSFNSVAVNGAGKILGFGKEARSLGQTSPDIRLRAFTGIHVLNPEILEGLEPGVPESILSVYRSLIRSGRPPAALLEPGLFWREMGTVQAYWDLHRELCRLPQGALPPLKTGRSVVVHPEAEVAPQARLHGMVVVGGGVRVGEGVELCDVVVWDRDRIEEGSCLEKRILAGQWDVAMD